MSSKTTVSKASDRRTQAERSQASERALLDAATELIAELGFSKTSFELIGQRAGYSRALVSHRFGSKEGIVKKLIEQISSNVYEATISSTDSAQGGRDVLLIAVDGYLERLERAKARARALYILMVESLGVLNNLHPQFEQLTENYVGLYTRLLQKAQDAGEIAADIDCKVAATGVVSQLRGITFMWLMSPETFDLKGARAELKQTLVKRFAM